MTLNVTWSPRWRLHDHMRVHASREDSFATASFRAGARRLTVRALPRVWELLFLGGANRTAPGPREHLLALSRTTRRRESTSRRDAIDA